MAKNSFVAEVTFKENLLKIAFSLHYSHLSMTTSLSILFFLILSIYECGKLLFSKFLTTFASSFLL